MRTAIDKLGKVAVTVEKDYWSNKKTYDKLTIVEKKGVFGTYISRKAVPAGIDITNREYWIPFSSLKEEIVLKFNELANSVNEKEAEIYNAISSIIVGGVALKQSLGNSEVFGISQKKITEEFSDVRQKAAADDDALQTQITDNNTRIRNIADEEDLTMVSVDEKPAIKLRDKAYEPEKYSGLGRKYLRKNITYDVKIVNFGGFVENVAVQAIGAFITDGNSTNVVYDRIRKAFLYREKKDLGTPAKYYDVWTSEEVNYDDYYQSSFTTGYTIRTDVVFMLGNVPYHWDENDQELAVWDEFYEAHSKNILTQAMIDKPNTIYHIQYDYDLNGQTITVPEGCTLEFDGGSLRNGTVIFNNSTINAKGVQIFNELHIRGTLTNSEMLITWWGVQRTFRLSTAPNDASKNTESLAVASYNTSILNTYVIDDLNNIGIRLTVDIPIWINGALNRIYGFDLNCLNGITYEGDDFYDGGIIEIGGSYRHHFIRLYNNYRSTRIGYPEYYTDGVLDAEKQYAARSESPIVGLIVRGMNNSTVDIDIVQDFTTGVIIKGGYGVPNLPSSVDYVSYSIFNINAIRDCLRNFVVNFDAGWVTECTVNKGRFSVHRPWLYKEGKNLNTAITFEDNVTSSTDSTSNWVFNQPCIEGALIGIKLHNVCVASSRFINVRNEGVQTLFSESENVKNVKIASPSLISLYSDTKFKNVSYFWCPNSFVIVREGAAIDVSKDYFDLPFRTIGIKDAGKVKAFCVENMMICYRSASIYTSLSGLSYTNFSPERNRPVFHKYYLPCVLFKNDSNGMFIATIYAKKDAGYYCAAYIGFLDENGNKIYVNANTGSYDSELLMWYVSTYDNIRERDYSVLVMKVKDIPDNVKTIVLGFEGSINRARVCVETQNSRINTNHDLELDGTPNFVFNCDLNSAKYYNKVIQKECKYDAANKLWVDIEGRTAALNRGITSQRPNDSLNGVTDKGFKYLDTTLMKEILSNRTIGELIHDWGGVTKYTNQYEENICETGKAYCIKINTIASAVVVKFSSTNEESGSKLSLSNPEYDANNKYYYFIAPNSTEYPFIELHNYGGYTKNYSLHEIEKKWIEQDGAAAGVNRSGTFDNKPAAADIYIGFKYFCTDKQTTEGATNGIEIIHKGNDVWVDALGRVVS